MRAFGAIDPGASGASAVICESGELHIWKPFTDWKDAYDTLSQVEGDWLFALEQVGAMPGQGVTSMFSFGANYGGWTSLLEGLRIPYILVTPQKWQKYILGSFPKGESKVRAREYIVKRYPNLDLGKNKKKAEGIIDAICLALYIKDNH